MAEEKEKAAAEESAKAHAEEKKATKKNDKETEKVCTTCASGKKNLEKRLN